MNVIETFEKSQLLDLIDAELGGGNYHLAKGLLDYARKLESRLKKAESERDALRTISSECMKTIERLNNALDDCGYIRDGEEYGK